MDLSTRVRIAWRRMSGQFTEFLNRTHHAGYNERFKEHLADMEEHFEIVEELRGKPYYERKRDFEWRCIRMQYKGRTHPEKIMFDLLTVENRAKYGELRGKIIDALDSDSMFYDKKQ